jgi:hypothetical protein
LDALERHRQFEAIVAYLQESIAFRDSFLFAVQWIGKEVELSGLPWRIRVEAQGKRVCFQCASMQAYLRSEFYLGDVVFRTALN